MYTKQSYFVWKIFDDSNIYDLYKTSIDGLHLTSWRPRWRYNTKEYFINAIVGSCRHGWLALSATSPEIDCKLRILYLLYKYLLFTDRENNKPLKK